MFTSETTFILGAGASNPYGYPTGKALIEQIIDCIHHDEIYILSKQKTYVPSKEVFEATDFKLIEDLKEQHLYQSYQEIINNPSLHNFDWKGQYFTCYIKNTDEKIIYVDEDSKKPFRFYKVKLSYFKHFVEFLNYLLEFDPNSIDSFLRDHPQFSEAGKLMICYILLKKENINMFRKNIENRNERKKIG